MAGHLCYDKIIEVEKDDSDFYKIKKLNYNEDEILNKYKDKDGLIPFEILKEDPSFSKPDKRIYELDGFWFFIPSEITKVIEYLYSYNLIQNSKIKLTSQHTIYRSRLPIINLNYEQLYKRVVQTKSPINAHFYCEHEKDYDDKNYADFYVLGNLNNNEIQFELWEIFSKGDELFYSHFIKDLNANSFKHFDLATHIKKESASIEDLLYNKVKPELKCKIKWFRNDDNFTEGQILEITKLFFPLETLVDEFCQKNYG